MLDFIHSQGKAWGRYMRQSPTGYSSRSVMGRIVEEGSVGAAIKQFFQKIPVTGIPRGVLPFHRAYLRLPERLREVIFVTYVVGAERDAKAEALGITKSHMYRLLDQAHYQIAGGMDVEETRLNGLQVN